MLIIQRKTFLMVGLLMFLCVMGCQTTLVGPKPPDPAYVQRVEMVLPKYLEIDPDRMTITPQPGKIMVKIDNMENTHQRRTTQWMLDRFNDANPEQPPVQLDH